MIAGVFAVRGERPLAQLSQIYLATVVDDVVQQSVAVSAAGLHGPIVAQRSRIRQSAELGVKAIHAVRVCRETVVERQCAVSLCSVVEPANAEIGRIDAPGMCVAERELVPLLP